LCRKLAIPIASCKASSDACQSAGELSARLSRATLGDELVDSYAKLKLRQWDAYSAAISPWEREQTLDC
jgi:glutamine synthetase